MFTREPTIVTTGDPWLPRPVGHVVDKETNARYLVHSVKGVACGPRLVGDPLKIPGGTLLEDGTGAVRPLLPEEVWEMQGGDQTSWEATSDDQKPLLVRAAVREIGWQAAQSLLQAVSGQAFERAGVLDPDEIQAQEQLEVWLKAWGRNPRNPSQELFLTSWKEKASFQAPTHCAGSSSKENKKVGGPLGKRASKAELTTLEGLIQPAPASCRKNARTLAWEVRKRWASWH